MPHVTKAVIFDLDGTLLNTLDDLHASVSYALETLSLPPRTKDETRLAVGDGIGNLIARSIEGGKNNPRFAQCLSLFSDYYQKHSAIHTTPYPALLPLLNTLRQKGILIGVVSNKIDSAVQALTHRYFEGLIDCAVGEREGVRRKPAPDSLLHCLEALGTLPEHALYIGDSEQDILTAQNANVPCLSVTWGFRDKTTLLAAGGKAFVDTPSEIRSYHNISTSTHKTPRLAPRFF